APYTRALLAAVPRLGAMKGEALPLRFPVVGKATGEAAPVPPSKPTVDAEKPLLQVQNLVTRFDIHGGTFGGLTGRVHAVADISFDLHAGETLSLVGESGCGKSTTGRSVMRLVQPTAGRILMEGVDMAGLDRQGLRRMRKQMQMIFQDPVSSLNARMTIGEAIAEPFLVHRMGSRRQARDKAAHLLEQV